MKLYLIFYFILLLISLLAGVFFFKKNKAFIFLILLIFLSVITEIGNLLINENKKGSYIWYHLFTPIEYSLLCFYFMRSFKKRLVKQMLVVSQVAFVAFCGFISIRLGLYQEYPSYLVIVEVILVLFWSFFYLFSKEPELNSSIFKDSLFWINIGLIFYFSGVFFIDGIFKSIISSNRLLTLEIYHTILNCTFNYLLYIFFIIGFCVKK